MTLIRQFLYIFVKRNEMRPKVYIKLRLRGHSPCGWWNDSHCSLPQYFLQSSSCWTQTPHVEAKDWSLVMITSDQVARYELLLWHGVTSLSRHIAIAWRTFKHNERTLKFREVPLTALTCLPVYPFQHIQAARDTALVSARCAPSSSSSSLALALLASQVPGFITTLRCRAPY